MGHATVSQYGKNHNETLENLQHMTLESGLSLRLGGAFRHCRTLSLSLSLSVYMSIACVYCLSASIFYTHKGAGQNLILSMAC